MKNKSSSRMIAWLLALVMIFNIAPVTTIAVAEGGDEEGVTVESNRANSPKYSTVKSLSDGPAPDETLDQFTVQYVIRGDYTYFGDNIVLDEYTKMVPNANPSTYSPDAIAGCSVDGNSRTWDESTKTLTFYPVPNTCSIQLRYMLIFENADHQLEVRTFQIMQNKEAGLEQGESLEFKDFLKSVTGNESTDNIVVSQYQGTDIKQVLPFTIPKSYLEVDSIVQTSNNRDYKIEYYGHNFGITDADGKPLDEGAVPVGDIIRSKNIAWSYGQEKICLYYKVEAASEEDVSKFFTVTWLDEDGTQLDRTKVKEGATPVYRKATPTKASDDTYDYTFAGWTPEVVPVTADATYTATYTPTPKPSESPTETPTETPVPAKVSVRYVLDNPSVTPEGFVLPTDSNLYKPGDQITPAAAQEFNGYTFSGWAWGQQTGTITVPDNYTYDGAVIEFRGYYNKHTVGVGFNTDNGGHLSSYGYWNQFAGSSNAEIPQGSTVTIGNYAIDRLEFDRWTVKVNGVEYELTGNTTARNPHIVPQIGDDPNATDEWTNREYYAHLKEKTANYTVTYKIDGQQYGNVDTVAAGTTVTVRDNPTREGYTFSGWKINNADAGTSFTMPAANVEVIGSWTLKNCGYTVHHYLKGTSTKVAEDETRSAAYGSSVSATPVTHSDILERDLTVDSYNPSQSITIREDGNVITVYYTLPLEIKAINNEKNYGAADPALEATVTGALSSDTITATASRAEGEDAGTYKMTAAAAEGTTIPEYYSVSYVDGTFTIKPIDVTVTITGHNNTTVYDGTEHSVSGYDVVISDPLFKESDINFTGSASAARTDVGTTNMGLTKDQFSTNNKNFGTVTFNVTDGYQTITKLDVTVTVSGHKGTAPYDGSEHKTTGYDVEISNDLYKEADINFTGSAEAKRTVVGTTRMNLAASQFANRNNNFNVTFTVAEDGEQTITAIPVNVTITGKNNTAPYDGTEHSVSGYDVAISNPLYTEADFTFTGSAAEAKRTNAGTTNMGLAVDQFTNTNPNFVPVFAVTDGYQTITAINVTVTITGNNNTATYDGKEHSVSGYTATASSTLYNVDNDIRFSGTAEAKRTDEGTTDMGLAEEQFSNRNGNFNVTFSVTDGYQTITPVEAVVVTITGHKNTADYDSTEHSVSGYDVEISNPLYTEADFSLDGAAEAKRTDEGTTYMGLTPEKFTNNNTNFKDVTFVVTDGYQTISPINVTVAITGANSTDAYDGKEHKAEGYDVVISNPLYTEADFTFSGTKEAARTDVGTTDMGLTKDQFTNNNTNFNVTFNVTDGYQTISPINVTVRIVGANSTDPYDGTEHSVSGYTATASSDLFDVDNDIRFSGTAEAKRTDEGTTNMGLAADQFANTNTNFGTVTFDVTDGYQTITPIDGVKVTITGANSTVDYDGEPHKVEGYTAAADNDLYDVTKDFTYTGSREANRTDAGTTYMGLPEGTFRNTNPNFTNVTFEVADGYQTVNPITATVTIVGENNTTAYDGQLHTVTGYTATTDSTLYNVDSDFTYTGSKTASRTDAGTTNMGLTEGTFTNTNKNFSSVTFNVTDGYQTITAIDVTVTITEHSGKVSYNGAEHTVTGYDVAISNPLYKEADFRFTGDATVKGTDAGSYPMELSAEDFANTNDNFANVTFEIVDGQLVIDPIDVTVTITEHSSQVNYNGKEQTVTGYDVAISNPLYKETDFTFSGNESVSGTDAGAYEMELKKEDFANTNANFANVTFTIVDGALVIKPIDVTVTITGANSTDPYDGKEHTVTGYGVAISDPLYKETDFTFDGNQTAARTDVGTTNMGLKANQFTNTNANFGTVTFDVTDGYQAITPVEEVVVTITGRQSTLPYDGTEHSVEGYSVAISDPLYKETDFTFSGTKTAAQTDVGTAYMGLAESQFTNNNTNFKTVIFKVTDGYQAIEPINVTVTVVGANDTTDYDGEEHSVSGYTATADSSLYDVTKDFTFSGTQVAARTDVGTTKMGLAAGQFTNTNPNFSLVTFDVTDGYQTIKAIDVTVTITGHNATVNYDGEEHSVSGYEATFSTPLYTAADFTYTGSETASRTDAGTTNMGLTEGTFTNTNTNFGTVTFNVTDGYQTISPIKETVTITEHSAKVDYDGKLHTVSGYDVSIPEGSLYKATDFTFSGNDSVSGTDAGSYEMKLKKEDFINTNPNFTDVEFVIVDGQLEIDPIDVTVTITEHGATADYDGQSHTVSGYDVSASTPLYTAADFTFSGKDSVSGTDADSYDMELKPEDFTNTNDNFANVTFVIADGQLVINPIDVTVTIVGNKDTKTYDGEEHSVTGYSATATSNLYDVTKDFTFKAEAAEAKRTNWGTEPMGLTKDQFENTNGNFNVTFEVTDGAMTIEKRSEIVVITGHTDTQDYDSTEHSVSGYDVKFADGSKYTEADFTFTGSAEAARTDVGTEPMGLADTQFTNDNENYIITFSVKDGGMTIKPIDVVVTITEHSGSEKYDGTEKTVTGYDVSFSNELYTEADFTFTGSASISGTDAGTYDMELTEDDFTNTNENFANVTFEIVDGTLVIDPIDVTVTITEHSGSEKYDGTEKTVTGYDVAISNALYTEADFTFSGDNTVKGTDAGSYPMELKAADFTNTNSNFGTVTFEIVDGTLEIGKRTVTLTSANDEKVYDGTALTNGNVTVGGDGFANGEGAAYDVTGTITNAGTTPNAFTYTLNEGTKAGNYDISTAEGELKITPYTDEYVITVTGNSDTQVYNAKEQSVNGYTVSEYDQTITFTGINQDDAKATAKGTNVGTYTMTMAEGDFSATSDNYTNIKITVVPGTLEITPITDEYEITVTGNSGTKVYNTEEQSVSGYTVSEYDSTITFNGIAQDDEKATAKGTDVDTYTMTMTAEDFSATSDNYSKIKITVVPGTLEITPITDEYEITVTGKSDTQVYNGKEQSVNGYTVSDYDPTITFRGIAQDDAKATAKGTDADTYTMAMTEADFSAASVNYTNIRISVVPGTLAITPITEKVTVAITENGGSEKYDGTEKTVTGYEVTGISNELYTEANIKFTGDATVKGTDAGDYDMELSEADFANVSKNFTNVEFVITDGKLVISKRTVTMTSADGEKVYDGTALTNGTVTEDGDGFADGEGAEYDVTGTITDAGTTPNAFSYTLNEGTKADNYTITTTPGTLTVSKRTVTLTSADDSKVYDGTALTNDEVTEGEDGFADGEGAAYDVTGTITNVGIESNDFTYELNENTKADNYTITTTPGTLEVTPVTDKVTVTITEHGDEVTYDGTEQSVEGYDVAISNPLYKEADFTFSGDDSISGTDAGSYDMELSAEDFKNDSKNFTNVAFVIEDGTLEISPRTVTLTSADDEKVYDGKALTNDGVTVGGDGFVDGEGATYDVTGTITNVGTEPNAFTYELNEGTKADNYEITTTPGTLEVTPATLEVTAEGYEGVYDGLEHKVSVTVSVTEGTTVEYSLNGGETWTNEVPGITNVIRVAEAVVTGGLVRPAGLRRAADEATTVGEQKVLIRVSNPNYETVNTEVTLKVNPVTATVTADDKDIVFGDPEPELTVTITGLIESEKDKAAELIKLTGITREEGNTAGEYKITPEGLVHQGNYDVTYVPGKLLIRAKELLYNYITFDNGETYLSLEPTEIVAMKPASEYVGKGHLEKDTDYEADDYDLNGVSWYKTVNGNGSNPRITYVNADVAKSDQPSYTAELEYVYADNGAPYTTGTITPTPAAYSVADDTPVFRRYYKATLTDVPRSDANQPLLTVVKYDNSTYYGIEWIDNFTEAIDSRYVPFGHNLEEGTEFTIADYDFTNLVLTGKDGIKYYNVNSPEYKNNKDLPYYTATFIYIQKQDKTSVMSGTITQQAKDHWKDIYGNADPNASNKAKITNYSGTDGYPYAAGFYHRDYQIKFFVKSFKVTFKNWNGNVLKGPTSYKYSTPASKVTEPDNMPPTKAEDNNYTYVFDGWDKPIEDVTKDAVYTATYKPFEARYTVHHYLYGTDGDPVQVAPDQTGKWEIGKSMTVGKSPDLKPEYADSATVVGYSKGEGEIMISQTIADNEVIVYYKVPLTITASTASKPYDGTALTDSGFTVSGLVNGDTISDITATVTGSITNVSENPQANTVASYEAPAYYEVATEDGELTITPIPVTVTIVGANNTTPYDGTEHTVTGYTATANSTLYNVDTDFTFSEEKAEAKRTDAGTTNMGLADSQFTNTNSNFGPVTFAVTDGYQTITPINAVVTIVGATGTAPYDGTEHTVTGYSATADTTLYDVTKDFTFSGTKTASRTDVGKTGMNLASSQFTNTNPNFATVTFNVTDGYQTITPIDVVVTIVGANNTTVYDGANHTVTGYTATADTDLYDVENDFNFSGSDTAVRKNVGTTNMGLAASQFTNTNPNFGTVTFNVTDGYQTITPLNVVVTITGNNSTDVYDGSMHTVHGFTATADSTLYDVKKDLHSDGQMLAKQKDVGTDYMELTESQFENRNSNFNVSFVIIDGYQKITPVDEVVVTIKGHKDSKPYDGTEHSVTGYDAVISNPLYTEADFTFTEPAAAARTDAGTTYMGLQESQFTNKSPNFEKVTFVIEDGAMTITPIPVTVTIVGANNTTAYDGQPHTVTGYTATANKTLYDVTKDFTFSKDKAEAVRTDAGTTYMGLADSQFTNINPNFSTVTFNVTDGYQEITPIDVTVTITGATGTAPYDGTEHTVTGYTATADTPLYTVTGEGKDFTFSGTETASRTIVGKTGMGLASSQFENTNKNFATVTFNVTDGWQEITPINAVVTIVGKNNTTDYDGSEHKVEGYTATANTPLYNVGTDFTFTGTDEAVRTDAGTTNMGLAADQFTNTNTNFATVTFEVTDGYQTITPIDVTVTITGATDTKPYDGADHTVTGYTAKTESTLYDVTKYFTFSGSDTATRKDAGTTNMGLAADQFENTNTNFKTVTFEVTDGWQKITPIDVTVEIVGSNNTTDYNGEEHTVTGYTATPSTTLYDVTKDFTFSGTDTASRTDAGTTNMGLAADQFTNTNTNFGTVTFEVTDGYQKINPINVTVTVVGEHNSTTYDAKEHSVSGYTATASNKLYDVDNDFTFSGTAEAARTDEGTTYMGMEAAQFTNTNTNFKTVTFEVTDGYQEIVPVDEVVVTIVGNNDTTDYDGTEHSVSGYTATASNDLYDVDNDFTFSGTAEAKRTDAGTTEMGLSEDQFENTNPNFATVTFVVTDGYQKIEPINATVTITGHTDTADYDGKEHTVTGYDAKTESKLYDVTKDFNFIGTAEAKRTNKGTTKMGLAEDQFENTNENFSTVTFVVNDGWQKIDPIDVTVEITGNSNSTDYDGSEHTVTGYTAKTESKLYDVTKDFTFSGTAEAKRTNAGTTDMGLKDSQFANENENFRTVTFVVTDGWQEIKPIDVTVEITGETNTADYDGKKHTVTGYTAKTESTLYDVTKDFTFSGNKTASRTIVGTTEMGLKADQFTNTNANFRTVTFNVTDGWQKIEPIDVTVTIVGNNDTTDYDSKEHKVTGYTATADTDLYDVTKDFTFSGTAEAKRTDVGTTDMGLAADQFENTNTNFGTVTFNVTDGYQTIEPIGVVVTITEHSGTYEYDAANHTVEGYDVSISDPLYTENDFTFSGNARVTGKDAKTYPMTLKPTDFTNTNPNFDEVTFVIVDGGLEITPKPLKITADDKTKTYGDEDPTLTETVEGLAGTDTIVTTLTRAEGETVGIYTITPYAEDPNYTIEFVDGTLTIEPKAVTVTANDKAKVFGEADPALTADVTGLVNGESIDLITYSLSRAEGEEVGSYAITPAGEETQGNYTVTYVPATLTIAPLGTVIVTITGNKGEYEYDGTEKDASGYSVSISDPLYTEADFSFSGSSVLKAVNAGTYATGLKKEQFANTNPNFTNVTFVVNDGSLTITPRSITLTSADGTKVYDGTPLVNNSVTVTSGELAQGDSFTFETTARITNPGSTGNTFTYTIVTGSAGNYVVSTVNGTLTVTPAPEQPQTEQTEEPEQPKIFDLVITFVDVTTGDPIGSVTIPKEAGTPYSETVPDVNGYIRLTNTVTGTMPNGPAYATAFFTPVGTEETLQQVAVIVIDEYGTPLGIENTILGNGEIIE